MKKRLKIGYMVCAAVITILIASSIIQIKNIALSKSNVSENFDIEINSLTEILDNAKEIKLEKKLFSLNKHYYIMVDNVVVGEVKGEFLTLFGDTLTMTDVNGYTVKKEHQIKRIGPTKGKLFNVSLDRLAEIRDGSDNITGYIGEQKLKDLLNLNHKQYFYNEEAFEMGMAKPDFFIFSKDYRVFNNEGNIDYDIDGNIFSLKSKTVIKKVVKTDIDEENIIFYTIMENSIIDSKS